MSKYSTGTIYTIRCRTDDKLIYVGSTIQPLHKRFHQHKRHSKCEKNMTMKLYVEVNDNWDNWYIELYENYPCNTKTELCKREGEVIRLIGTLNSKISGRDIKEWRIDNVDKIKQYYIDNIEKLKEQKKQYQIENVDKIKERKKEYYLDNVDKIKDYAKQYQIDNVDKMKEYKKKYQIENAEKLKQYYIENKDKINEKKRLRYLKKKNEKLKELGEATT